MCVETPAPPHAGPVSNEKKSYLLEKILRGRLKRFEPWLSVCRALSGSVGALSGLCRDSVGTLSVDNCRASVGLCRLILTVTMCVLCRPLSVCRDSVGLSVCRSVGLCR